MKKQNRIKKHSILSRTISSLLIIVFTCMSVLPAGIAHAQVASTTLNLPQPGVMVGVTPSFVPTQIDGLRIFPDNPLQFDFYISNGDTGFEGDAFEAESAKLIKYFLSALTTPDEELWVNLSPFESDRIIPDDLSKTAMGRDLLTQDYMLKQLTASLMYPEESLGDAFWDRVYAQAKAKLGTTDIPLNTFNKIWIIPEQATIYEQGTSVFVVNTHLKVLLEEDYVALKKSKDMPAYGLDDLNPSKTEIVSGVTSQAIKDILIPAIEKEVNEGETFANLRQIYNTVILAKWFKENLRNSILGQVYVDQKKTSGITIDEADIKEKVYKQYLEAYKVGVYDYIKEDYDPATQMMQTRKFFSGGADLSKGKVNKASAIDPSLIGKGGRSTTRVALKQDSESKTQELAEIIDLATVRAKKEVERRKSSSPRIFAQVADAALLASVEKRHNDIHIPRLNELLLENKDVLQPLVDRYNNPSDSEDMDALNDQISSVIDKINADEEMSKSAREGNVSSPEIMKLSDFKELRGNMGSVLQGGIRKGFGKGGIYNHYLQKAKTAVLNGDYVPQLLFAGKATRLNRGAMYKLDIWDIAVEQGWVTEEESSKYRFGNGPRQILAYRILLTRLAREAGMDIDEVLANQNFIIHLNDEVEDEAFEDLRKNKFYGFDPENIIFVNQPQFKGVSLNNGVVKENDASDILTYGHGDNLVQLAEEGDSFRIDRFGQKTYLGQDALESLGERYVGSHRVNDLTKFSSEEVLSLDRLAMGMYLQEQGYDVVTELVDNPIKSNGKRQKGGTAIRDESTGKQGLMETLWFKGSPELDGYAQEMSDKGAPYNAFRLLYRADKLKNLLKNNQIKYYLRFKNGHFYLEAVTGDITLSGKTAFIQSDGEIIHDFKEANADEMQDAMQWLKDQDRELKANGIMPEGYSSNLNVTEIATVDNGYKIEFKTSGWRDKIGDGFEEVNVVKAAQGTAEYMKRYEPGKVLLIGYDTRRNNKELARKTAAIMAANGIQTRIISADATPTPVLAYLASVDGNVGGLVNLTASHSPGEDSGYKFSPGHGGAAPESVTNKLQDFANGAKTYQFTDYQEAVEKGYITEVAREEAAEKYVKEYILPTLKAHGAFDDIVKYFRNDASKSLILDPMQGTGIYYMKVIYDEISDAVGRKIYTMLHANTDQDFKDVAGGPRPDDNNSNADLREAVRTTEGAMGLSVDGDSDRFGTVDFNGEYVSANTTIPLLTWFLNKEIGLTGAIGKTVATSNFVNAIAEYLGLEIDEEPVGFKWFVKNANENKRKYLVAGEESAHATVGPFARTWDDGFAVGLTTLWMVARTGKSVADYKEEIESTINRKFIIQNDEVKAKGKEIVTTEIRNALAVTKEEVAAKLPLNEMAIVQLVESMQGQKVESVNVKDGIKIVFEKTGDWILMRPSGTEEAVKLYVEVTDEARLEKLMDVANRIGTGKVKIAKQSTEAKDAIDENEDILAKHGKRILNDMQNAYGKTFEQLKYAHPDNVFLDVGFDKDKKTGEMRPRLGWTTEGLREILEEHKKSGILNSVLEDAKEIRENYEYVIMSGMGGSGVSVETVHDIYNDGSGPRIISLRDTDPSVFKGIVDDLARREGGDLKKALKKTKIVINTKSATTPETVRHYAYFKELYEEQGVENMLENFMLVSDPGTHYRDEARKNGFQYRDLQMNEMMTDVGGRFTSPTTRVFMLPVALMAPDKLIPTLERALEMNTIEDVNDDQFMQLATYLFKNGVLKKGVKKDKVTLVLPKKFKAFQMWLEQLFEESLGKQGRGITLVYEEDLDIDQLKDAVYDDRAYVRINLGGLQTNAQLMDQIKSAGYPVFDLNVDHEEDIGGVMLGFQRVIATLGSYWTLYKKDDEKPMNVVDQDGVDSYKFNTNKVMDEFNAKIARGELPANARLDPPDDWEYVAYKGLKVYYTPMIQAGVITREELANEVKRIYRKMVAPATYRRMGIEQEEDILTSEFVDGTFIMAALINLSSQKDKDKEHKGRFELGEFASFGQMTGGFREAMQRVRTRLFTNKLKIASKLAVRPDGNHFYQQSVQDGPDYHLSTFFLSDQIPQPDVKSYDKNVIRAQAIGTTKAIIDVGRKAIFVTLEDETFKSARLVEDFYAQVEEMVDGYKAPVDLLQSDAAMLVEKEVGGIDLNIGLTNWEIKGDGSLNPRSLINLPELDGIQIDGFVPVIINITPVINAPFLIGETQELKEDINLSRLQLKANEI